MTLANDCTVTHLKVIEYQLGYRTFVCDPEGEPLYELEPYYLEHAYTTISDARAAAIDFLANDPCKFTVHWHN